MIWIPRIIRWSKYADPCLYFTSNCGQIKKTRERNACTIPHYVYDSWIAHFINNRTATDAYLELILKIGGDGFAAIVDEYGSMLLYYAAASRASKPMMQRIIKKHPSALKKGDVDYDRLPLHRAWIRTSKIHNWIMNLPWLPVTSCKWIWLPFTLPYISAL